MKELTTMTLHELCDLLVDRTIKLLKAIDLKQTDSLDFHELKKEVEKIQGQIHTKRSELK